MNRIQRTSVQRIFRMSTLLQLKSLVVLLVLAVNLGSCKKRQPPQLGRSLREHFYMEPDYVFLNHGSYGTYPKAVAEALHEYQVRAEENPDLWMRRDAKTELDKVRKMLATVVSADADDIVMVPNTTSGINAIFRSMVFELGQRILHLSTIYGSMGSIIDYIIDHSQGAISKLVFNVTYPITNDEFIQNLETFLDATHDPENPIRIALVDHITSVPAVVIPIERVIPILKRRNITVLIDGAHAIGQVPINITALAPDYYVTNAHKWLYAPRGAALLYVDKKHQATIHPAHINSGYSQPANYQQEFFWTGTMDYSPYMAVPAALAYREYLGGEQVIMEYNHNLAVAGGQLMAERLQTRVMQSEDQIGSMVDVQLPVKNPDDSKLEGGYWIDMQLDKYNNTFAPVYKHNGTFWVRMSAQVYLDISDFELCAENFIAICDEINNPKGKAGGGWSSGRLECSITFLIINLFIWFY